MNIRTDLDLKSTFDLIQEIKKNIKQKCCIIITEVDIGVSEVGLLIAIETKNYKTNEEMYFQKIISEKELNRIDPFLYHIIVKKIIEEANYYFKKEKIQ